MKDGTDPLRVPSYASETTFLSGGAQMTWDEQAGLDPDNLYLEDKAADDVGNLFGKLKTDLEALRRDLSEAQPDLGMNGCK